MIRKIVTIKDELCDGCGDCVTSCSEGALEIIDGKAKIVKENFCDGFGDCIGTCPTGALVIEEKDVAAFDEDAVKIHLMKTQGFEAVKKMEDAQKRHHGEAAAPEPCGCPGSAMRTFDEPADEPANNNGANQPSQLRQWPIQIHLVPPSAPFFQNKELVVMNTCGPLASANVHNDYLKDKGIVIGCPKLDNTQPYSGKLAAILQYNNIPKVTIVRMEVPCCGGLTMIVNEAIQMSGRDDIEFQEDILALDGSLKESKVHNKVRA